MTEIEAIITAALFLYADYSVFRDRALSPARLNKPA